MQNIRKSAMGVSQADAVKMDDDVRSLVMQVGVLVEPQAALYRPCEV